MLRQITDDLVARLRGLSFAPPVSHVYNPLIYARAPWDTYCRRYGQGSPEVLFLGMNPGPFGMAQVGVPFGEIAAVRDWLGIRAAVGRPPRQHPRRPVQGFDCPRSEVSGRRFWGWAKERFGTPEAFFSRFFVANYCPLLFIEESGRNRVPEKLPRSEREPLFRACDEALRRTVDQLGPSHVIGVGRFAEKRARAALGERRLVIGSVPHPSPANPRANRGWAPLADEALRQMGLEPWNPRPE